MSSLRRTAGPRTALSKRIQRWPLSSAVIVTLIVALIAAWPVRAQPFFEIVQRGQVDQALVAAAAQATLHSLASLARLGVVLDGPPTVYLCATKADYADVLVELGLFDRPAAERRATMYSGQSALGAFALNLEYIASRTRRPAEFLWRVVPHEVFHLYQRQSRMDRLGTPFAFWEAPADLHKLRVLDERRIIDFEGYARSTVAPRAQRARRNLPTFSIQQRSISAPDAQTLSDYYAIATALGLYMFENGGWPRVIALYAPGEAPFVARFETIYGKRLQEFEQEFFGWLDRK